MKSKRIALLGGSFDPIHLGHLALAEEVRQQIKLDAVWFLPAFISPNKSNADGAGPDDRLAMVRCAIAGREGMDVCDVEIKRQGTSYTFETLEALHTRHPEYEWYWILGLDTFFDFPSWKNYRRILELAHLVVAPRPGLENVNLLDTLVQLGFHDENDPVPTLPSAGVKACPLKGISRSVFFLGSPRVDFSSTQIRRQWATDPAVKKMLPPPVVQYIMNHQLYV